MHSKRTNLYQCKKIRSVYLLSRVCVCPKRLHSERRLSHSIHHFKYDQDLETNITCVYMKQDSDIRQIGGILDAITVMRVHCVRWAELACCRQVTAGISHTMPSLWAQLESYLIFCLFNISFADTSNINHAVYSYRWFVLVYLLLCTWSFGVDLWM